MSVQGALRAEWRRGYERGELERIALATANSQLRSANRELRRRLAELEKEVASRHPAGPDQTMKVETSA